jgi:CheY-like chemotaxis protein
MPVHGRNAYCMKMARVALIAEDDRMERARISEHLWGAGFQTSPVAHSPALAERLCQPPPTVVLMTAEFAQQQGGDWLAELARRPGWRDVPVIVATNTMNSVFAESLRRSGVPVLQRPIDPEELLRALEAVGLPPINRERKPLQLRRTVLVARNRSRS